MTITTTTLAEMVTALGADHHEFDLAAALAEIEEKNAHRAALLADADEDVVSEEDGYGPLDTEAMLEIVNEYARRESTINLWDLMM